MKKLLNLIFPNRNINAANNDAFCFAQISETIRKRKEYYYGNNRERDEVEIAEDELYLALLKKLKP